MLQISFVKSLCRTTLILSSLFVIGGCLPSDEQGASEDGMAVNGAASEGNTAPMISGLPRSQAAVDQLYSFQPNAFDPDGDDMTFAVQGLPDWASFNTSNGRISGTPEAADVATFTNITITVSDGAQSQTLAPFSITVDTLAMGSATLSWQPPAQNTDGTPLTDLSGYRIYWGAESGEYTESLTVDNPGITTYVVENLTAGNYYFASTALNAAGIESDFSNEAQRSIQN